MSTTTPGGGGLREAFKKGQIGSDYSLQFIHYLPGILLIVQFFPHQDQLWLHNTPTPKMVFSIRLLL